MIARADTFELRSGLDGFSSTLGTALIINPLPGSGARSIDLSGNSSFQNLSAPVEFRLYGYGENTDTLGLAGPGDDLVISGSTIPEARVGLLLLGSALVALAATPFVRRLRRASAVR